MQIKGQFISRLSRLGLHAVLLIKTLKEESSYIIDRKIEKLVKKHGLVQRTELESLRTASKTALEEIKILKENLSKDLSNQKNKK